MKAKAWTKRRWGWPAALVLGVGLLAVPVPAASAATAATVTGIASRSGPVEGGQRVTILGTHLDTVTGVKFGSVAAHSYTSVSDHEITLTTPTHGAGRTYVRVSTSLHGTSPQSEVATYIFTARLATLANGGNAHTHSDLGSAEVSCASATWCGAGGFDYIEPSGFGHEAGEVFTGHGWGPQKAFEDDSFSPATVSVSCVVTPSRLCQFATYSGRVYRTTNGTTWSVTTLTLPGTPSSTEIPQLSCATSTSCTAVYGADSWTWNGASWSAAEPVLGTGGRPTGTFNDVSCPTTTFCQAVLAGSPAQVIRRKSGVWGQVEAVPTTASGAALQSITCSGSTFCLVRGNLAAGKAYLSWTGLAWSPPQPGSATATIPFGESRPSLQCLSGMSCVRANRPSDPGTAYSFQTYNGVAHSQAQLPPVSCWATYQCLVVGENSSYVTKKGTS